MLIRAGRGRTIIQLRICFSLCSLCSLCLPFVFFVNPMIVQQGSRRTRREDTKNTKKVLTVDPQIRAKKRELHKRYNAFTNIRTLQKMTNAPSNINDVFRGSLPVSLAAI